MKHPTCPTCDSEKVIPIMYGFPSEELFIESEKGKVLLGGCCIDDSSPKWYCKKCNHKWDNL